MSAAAGEARFPWGEIIAFGLGLLRLPPRHFWSMSFCEFRHVCGMIRDTPERLRRCELDRMMQLFPDDPRRKQT